MRAAIYARYSSDKQRETSIEDQVRLCREHALRLGCTVVAVHTDYAISGANALNRPALQAMLADARDGNFDILVSEALDRLSRDQEDTAGLFKRLSFLSVQINTVAEGAVGELHIGLKGTMNALFLKDLAQKVRRGQRGRVEAGKSAGGIAYGYRVVRRLTADGDLVRGEREIDPEKAEVVRRVFRDYIAGHSARAIAAALNQDGIPGPRGGEWNASTINGNRARQNGILHNAAYLGRIVYDRQTFRKDPDSGKRVPRVNSRESWVTVDVPELRIIDDATWHDAQKIKERHGTVPFHQARRPKRLLSGLVRCGVCGGPYSAIDREKMGCAHHRERGTCDNRARVRIDRLESAVLNGLRSQLLSKGALTEFVRTYRAELERLRADRLRTAADRTRKIERLTSDIERLVDHIVAGTDSPAIRERLKKLETEKALLVAEGASTARAAPVVELHPNAADLFRAKIVNLQEALRQDDAAAAEAIGALRDLIEGIVIRPTDDKAELDVELTGRLVPLIQAAMPAPKWGLMVVAGEGFEPPTKGL